MRRFLAVSVLASFAALAQEPAPAAAPTVPPAKKPVSNAVYKWVDDKGVIHYTDKPPSQNATPVTLPPLQTYKHGTIPDLKKFEPASPGKPITSTSAAPQIQVVTPAADETFHGGERTVPVAVVVTPALTGGQRLVYLLDGKPQPGPTTDTAYAVTEVDRGTHVASVVVIDGEGQELTRSTGVTFHVLPPIAKKK
jgi:hypothetical protein